MFRYCFVRSATRKTMVRQFRTYWKLEFLNDNVEPTDMFNFVTPLSSATS